MDQRSSLLRHLIRIFLGGVLAVCAWTGVYAEDPRLEIRMPDLTGRPGEAFAIPVYVDYLADTLDGFTVSIGLTRDDLIYFEVDTVQSGPDTLYVCQFDTSGTLSSGWQFVAARSIGRAGLDVRLTGVADLASGTTPGLPPSATGVLIKFFGRIRSDIPDDLIGDTVGLNVLDDASYYSNSFGQLIQPVLNTDGSVAIWDGIPGDLDCNGAINPTDGVYLVNYVYKNWTILCRDELGDLNCDSRINPVDIVQLVSHIYKGWPIPPCR